MKIPIKSIFYFKADTINKTLKALSRDGHLPITRTSDHFIYKMRPIS